MLDLISVIIPVYKTERYLIRCVSSILDQTYKQLEIILVDDGSPDGCPKICDFLSEKYKCIKVIHKLNGGLSSARNVGIENASGKYVSFIDSDDYVDKYMIERLYSAIVRNNADVAMVQYREVRKDPPQKSPKCKKEVVYQGSEIEEAFLKLKIDSVCVGLYAYSTIANFRFPQGKSSEDIPFNFEIFRIMKKFVYIPEKRYYYYNNPESISNGPLDSGMFNYLFFRKEIFLYYCSTGNLKCRAMSEALYARAAFGLLLRLTLYGNTEDLNRRKCISELHTEFREHKKYFFKEKSIPLSRKIIAFLLDHYYSLVKFSFV